MSKDCFVTGIANGLVRTSLNSHPAIDLLQRVAILASSEIWSIIEK